MRLTGFIAACATLVAGCIATPSESQTPKATVLAPDATEQAFPTDLRRVSLIVDDIDQSLKLYRDVLEFEVNYDAVVTMSGVALPAGEPGAKARLVLLSSNNSWVGWIGMLQWIDPPLERQYAPDRMGTGDAILVFNTEKVDQHCAAVAELPEVKVTAPPGNTVYPGRNGGPDITVRTCYLFDRDGYFMELNKVLGREAYNSAE